MKIKISLGFSVEVDDSGKFHLPDRKFSTSDLKKIAHEVNRCFRECTAEKDVNEVMYDE